MKDPDGALNELCGYANNDHQGLPRDQVERLRKEVLAFTVTDPDMIAWLQDRADRTERDTHGLLTDMARYARKSGY